MTLTPRELLEQDRALEAREAALSLPDGDAEGLIVRSHTDHLASSHSYQDYYRAMRGGVCPESDVFTRHLFVKRFASIRRLILERKHKTVLDLGCLDGWQLLNLAASGVTGVGVDLCPQSLLVAGERAAKWGFDLKFIESSIEDFEYKYQSDVVSKNGFDAVIISEVLEHVLDPAACFRTAVRHLAPGGVVYVSIPASPIPHHGKLEDAREHLRVFTEEQLKTLAKEAGLVIIQDQEVIEAQDQGQSYSHRMINFRRAKITVFCNHVTGGWNPEDLDDLGASEEMIVKVAESWVQQGHEVTVHQNGYEGIYNRVAYFSRAVAPKSDQDLLVLYKTLDYSDLSAGAKIFWTTDLPQPGQTASFLPPLVTDRLDRVLCISEYHRVKLLEACPWLDPLKTVPHWLGVDKEEIWNVCQRTAKVPGRVVYASSPDRGLSQLLESWPRVLQRRPDATLHVLYGFDFWVKSESVVPADQAQQMRQERERLRQLMADLSGVSYLGHLPRAEYLQELAEAEVWAYPCTGGELCCKTALEMQAAGCLPVVVPTMAVGETVQVGIKVDFDSFEEALIRTLTQTPPISASVQWEDVALPSWKDLADALEYYFIKSSNLSVQDKPVERKLPTEAGEIDQIPERFDRPHRTGILPSGTSLDITMAIAGMPFDGRTDRERNLGGSETAALQLSRELVRRGHRVSVFSNLPGQAGKFDGVSYLPISEWAKYAGAASHDVSIVQREPMAFNQQIRSKLNVLWCHDLGLLRYRSTFRSSLWNVDYIAPVSHWHGRQLSEVYDLPASVIIPMRNGIDLDLIAQATNGSRTRDRKALVYASRPERGLDLLLQSVFPRLLERDSELTLYVAGYENTVPEMEGFYQHCRQLMANLGPRAKWLGGLSKPDLYRMYSRAACMLYPSRNFEEVSCITMMEAAACGLPVVASNLGALAETTGLVPGFASLVEHPGQASEQFVNGFVEEAWRIIQDEVAAKRMSNAGRKGATSGYSWAGVAEDWEDFLIGALEIRSQNRQRLVRHWWRLGDLKGIESLPEEDRQLLNPQQQIAFNMAPQDTAPVAIPDHVIRAVAKMATEVKARSVLDLSDNGFGQTVGSISNATAIENPADFVFGIETLDCAENPTDHIAKAESLAKPGGYICLVIASPGVHEDRLFHGAVRRRRWVFDNHDARELFQGKPELLSIIIGGGAISEYDKQPLSWMLYQWKRPEVTCDAGKLDIVRRTRLQSPQPSLSGCLIVKNAENMLHRCLKSLIPYCDEIIVDDNGSTDSTKEILAKYGIEAQRGLSPLEVGFDEARNQGLARAIGDFVIWIDADEELLNGNNLPKYLRWSVYDGFGVSQHHFSADPPNVFKPDLPVRIFRRANLDGSPTGIRFFGFVHEHPEKQINHSVGQSVVLSDVHLAHDGYLTEAIRRKRFDRNIPLMFRDRIKYPDRVLGKFLMMRDWCHMARYSVEQNGRNLTVEAAHYLEAVLESYRKNFLGLTHMMAVDGLQYYNEALLALNRGFDVQITLKVGGADGIPHEVSYTGRVASAEDLEQLIKGSTHDLTGSWKEKYL